MKRIALTLALCLVAPLAAAQSDGIAGKWTGALDVQGTSLRIVINIETDGDGYRATLDSPDQGATGIPVTKVTFADPDLKLELANLGASFDAKLDGDSLAGTWRQSGAELPLTLARQRN